MILRFSERNNIGHVDDTMEYCWGGASSDKHLKNSFKIVIPRSSPRLRKDCEGSTTTLCILLFNVTPKPFVVSCVRFLTRFFDDMEGSYEITYIILCAKIVFSK